jgi:VWFA-related protein
VAVAGGLWIALALAWTGALSLAQEDDAQQPPPLDIDLVERTGRRLVQLDVSLTPKKKNAALAIPELAPADFDLVVNGRAVHIEFADRVCNVARTESLVAQAGETGASAPPSVPAPRQTATYIFYLEHTLLTMAGQNVALEMAERLIRELVRGGNRGLVVSSGSRVVQSELSDDPEKLLETIAAVRKDTRQWAEYAYAENELARYADIFRQPSTGSQRIAARSYQLEEMRITSNRFRRVSAMLGGLAEVDPPKALFYFADMARQRPGEHFIRLFSARTDELQGAYTEGSGLNHTFAFDDVLEQANAQGVRLYTIQAQGLQTEDTMPAARPNRAPNTRIRDAEDTMHGFALETGGEMFLGGTDAPTMGRILRRVEEDLACLYVLSFVPDELPEDQGLRVLLRLADTERGRAAAAEFDVHSRGQIVVQSPGRREETLLLAAHAAQETVDSDTGRGVVIPLGFDGKAYQGLVQFVVQGSDLASQLAHGSVWDLGMTHLLGTDVLDSVSARVEVTDPTAPVVLETLWSFEPGLNEIVSVGRERRLGQLATVKLDLDWPDPDQAKVTISPIAVVQQQEGVFLRKKGDEQEVRHRGTLAVGEGFVRTDHPAFLIELICRAKRTQEDLWVRRRLSGEEAADFELLHWQADRGERCIQVRDLVHEGQMSLGKFSYEVSVFDNQALLGEPVASARHEFKALPETQETATE